MSPLELPPHPLVVDPCERPEGTLHVVAGPLRVGVTTILAAWGQHALTHTPLIWVTNQEGVHVALARLASSASTEPLAVRVARIEAASERKQPSTLKALAASTGGRVRAQSHTGTDVWGMELEVAPARGSVVVVDMPSLTREETDLKALKALALRTKTRVVASVQEQRPETGHAPGQTGIHVLDRSQEYDSLTLVSHTPMGGRLYLEAHTDRYGNYAGYRHVVRVDPRQGIVERERARIVRPASLGGAGNAT